MTDRLTNDLTLIRRWLSINEIHEKQQVEKDPLSATFHRGEEEMFRKSHEFIKATMQENARLRALLTEIDIQSLHDELGNDLYYKILVELANHRSEEPHA